MTINSRIRPSKAPPCAKTCLRACKNILVGETYLSEGERFKIACEWQVSRRPVTTF